MDPKPTVEAKRDRRRDWMKSQWESNHVNFLMVFVVAIALVNVLFVAYQQWKFVPLKFPDARAFTMPTSDTVDTQVPADDSIIIRITGAAKTTGRIKVSAADSQDSFANPELAKLKWTVLIDDHGQAVLQVDVRTLPETFAITAFHDEDDNGRISENKLGAPIERYGFSGDQRFVESGVPPSYEQSQISRPPAGSTIDLFIR